MSDSSPPKPLRWPRLKHVSMSFLTIICNFFAESNYPVSRLIIAFQFRMGMKHHFSYYLFVFREKTRIVAREHRAESVGNGKWIKKELWKETLKMKGKVWRCTVHSAVDLAHSPLDIMQQLHKGEKMSVFLSSPSFLLARASRDGRLSVMLFKSKSIQRLSIRI